jgi:hypothetical protein
MKKYIVGIGIVALMMIMPCCAYGFTDEGGVRYNRLNQEPKWWSDRSNQSESMKVINIVIDRIDKSHIYAKDGRVFPLAKTTEIINNSNREARTQIGELIYKDGNLVALILK